MTVIAHCHRMCFAIHDTVLVTMVALDMFESIPPRFP